MGVGSPIGHQEIGKYADMRLKMTEMELNYSIDQKEQKTNATLLQSRFLKGVMRAVLLLLGMVAVCLGSNLMFNSCAKLAVETEQPISMSVNMPSTKAVINSKDDFDKQGSFGVFGYKVQGDSQGQILTSDHDAYHVFTNQFVENSKKGTDPLVQADWDYTPLKYWDTKEYMWYGFIAYSPYCDGTTNGPNVTTKMVYSYDIRNYYALTISGIPAWQNAQDNNCKDFMISKPEWGYGTQFVGKSPNPCYVEFTFKHILALIDIKAYVADNMDYNIEKISFGKDAEGSRVPKDSENTYSQGVIRKADEPAKWVDSTLTVTNSGVAEIHNSTTDHTKDSTLVKGKHIETNPKLISQQLAFPFKVTNKLNLSVSFNREGSSGYDSVEKLIDLQDIKGGRHYTILLRFEGGDVVDVNVSEVQDWNTIDRDHPVYNW